MPVAFTTTFGGAGQEGRIDEPRENIIQNVQTWINCRVTGRNSGLKVDLDAQVGVFPDGLVTDMVQAFHGLLADLASGEDRWASPCPVDLPAGQRARRHETCAATAPVPELLLHERVCAQAGRTPARTALL